MGDNAADPTTLRGAIAAATPGDTIDFSLTFPATITLTGGEIPIDKNLTITGPGANHLAVSGNNSSRIFSVARLRTVSISGLTIKNGMAGAAGAILNAGYLTLTGSTISDNVSGPFGGGAIVTSLGTNSGDTLILIDCTVTRNRTTGNGGGIVNGSFGTVTVTNSTISNNSTAGGGGGLWNNDSSTRLTLSHSSVTGNSALFGGGGIFSYGTLTLTGSTVSGNSSSSIHSPGGGISNIGVATLTNSTVAGNSVTNQNGGGISNVGSMTLTNSTVSGNSASGSGGGILNNGTLNVKNTIVANSLSGGNCSGSGTSTSYGHNLSDDNACSSSFTGTGDLNNIPAGLDPLGLQHNGGPTQTIALLATSPAVDAIPMSPTNYCTAADGTTPIATDQRGVPRPQASGCDIGAFELVQDDEGPVASNVQASPSPIAFNAAVSLTANVDDTATGGSDIASTEYTIDGGSPNPMDAVDGSFDEVAEDVTASVAPFAETGVYSLCVRGTDVSANVGAFACTLLPVYDPTGGFVTGGGIVYSPELADVANPSAAGPAKFGFVSKYLPGRTIPDGNLEFQFQAGNLNFKSSSMEWLVVTGEPRAIFRGEGTINGTTVCKFEVDAWDASYAPGGVDAFGLKIFACAAGGDRYSLPATPLTKGSIIIHRQ